MIDFSSSELWPLAQKILAFEEPSTKWLTIRRAIRRTDRRLEFQDVPDTKTLSLWQKKLSEVLAECRLSYQQDALAAATFMRVFALEEMERYESIALSSWRRRSHFLADQKEPDDNTLNSDQAAWLSLMLNLAPFMSLAQANDLAGMDFLARFAKDCLARFMHVSIDTAYDLDRTRYEFKQQIALHRSSLPGNFLPNFILLVEGTTEAILLPRFAALLGFNLASSGAMVVAAGGANQVIKRLLFLREVLKLPIFVLLDRDADTQSEIVQSRIRQDDRVHVLADGEIEDVLSNEVFVPLLNKYALTLPSVVSETMTIDNEEFVSQSPRKRILERLWRERKLGKFDKVGFAKFVAAELVPAKLSGNGLSPDGVALIKSICTPDHWNQRFYNRI